MDKNCDIFVIKKLHFVNILDLIWTWISDLLTCLDYGWIGLSFKYSRLDLDRKI